MAIFLFDLDHQTMHIRAAEYGAGPWRLVSMASYGDADSPLYAAIWHHEPGHPAQSLALRCTLSEIDNALAMHYNQWGMLPTTVATVSGPPTYDGYAVKGTNVRWSFVFDETQLDWTQLIFHAWTDLDTLVGLAQPDYTNPNRDIVSLAGLGFEDGSVAYSAILYPKASTPFRAAGLTQAWVQQSINSNEWEENPDTKTLRSGWARPEMVVPLRSVNETGDMRLVATLWRDDVFEPWPAVMAGPGYNYKSGAVVVGPLPAAFLQAAHNHMLAKGFVPYRVSAGGPPDALCVVYTRDVRPLDRQFVVVDARDPNPPLRVGVPHTIKKVVKPNWFDLLSSQKPLSGHDAAEVRAMGERGPTTRTKAKKTFRRSSSGAAKSVLGLDGVKLPDTVYPTGGSFDDEPVVTEGTQAGELAFNRYDRIDDWVRARMETSGARGAQVAIARGCKLVVSRAYTLAEEGYPVLRPTHLLGIGSIAKALTGMAIADLLFPNGEIGGPASELGLEMRLSKALGLTDCQSATIQQKLDEQPLWWILKHASGWPRDFDEAAVAAGARFWFPPAIPGDMLRYVRNRSGDFFAPKLSDGTYEAVYSGATLRALGERASQLFRKRLNIPPGEGDQYEFRMRQWWEVNPNVARSRARTPADCQDANIFPCHPMWIALADNLTYNQADPATPGPVLRLPAQFSGNYEFALPAGTWCMSAATCARILCGMDPASGPGSNVKRLLQPGAVQSMIDADRGSALFVWKPWGASRVTLLHNGGAPGVAAVGGIDFPGNSATSPANTTTCVVYLETSDDPSGALSESQVYDLRTEAIDIEDDYGWEGDDLFALP